MSCNIIDQSGNRESVTTHTHTDIHTDEMQAHMLIFKHGHTSLCCCLLGLHAAVLHRTGQQMFKGQIDPDRTVRDIPQMQSGCQDVGRSCCADCMLAQVSLAAPLRTQVTALQLNVTAS